MKELIKRIAKSYHVNILFLKGKLTKASRKRFQDKVDWYYISRFDKLSEDFIQEFKDHINWPCTLRYQILSENFIIKNIPIMLAKGLNIHMIFRYISSSQKLSEEFMENYKDNINWYNISRDQKLSESFIRKHIDKIDWYWISENQILSEDFIREFQDHIYWAEISRSQTLSENFIKEFEDRVYYYLIIRYQILSEKYLEELLEENFLSHISNINLEKCWLYATKEEKIKYIKENTDYEIIDDEYLILYKAVDIHNRSIYAPNSYTYEVGKEYESRCDHNINNENSFGLSAWTKKEAKEFYSAGNLLKVKVKIDDIGAIVQDSNKVRCKKFKIISQE